jgi:polyribonucleotide nucleotidyltransferase
MVAEVEVGQVYTGRVTRLIGMGAFVEILPGKEGLVHVSHLHVPPVRRPEEAVKLGDELKVRVIEVDGQGRVNLSAINLDQPFEPGMAKRAEDARGGGGRFGDRDRDRGGRGGGFGGRDRGGRGPGDRERGSRPEPTAASAPAEEEEESTENLKARFRPRR